MQWLMQINLDWGLWNGSPLGPASLWLSIGLEGRPCSKESCQLQSAGVIIEPFLAGASGGT